MERVREARATRIQSWKATPLAMRICFYAGVFSLFASVGVLALLLNTAHLSLLHIIVSILIMGGFAMVYAAVSIWRRYWLIPVFGVVEGFLFALVGYHYRAAAQLIPADSPLHQQLTTLGVTGIVSVVLGYTLFVVFFYRQGRFWHLRHPTPISSN